MSNQTRRLHLTYVLCFALLVGFGCASLQGGERGTVTPLRIADLLEDGDPARRASLRLVDQGLASDAAGDSDRALARYERALQVDSTNPYAFLAIARHQIAAQDPESALQFLDRAESLLELSGDRSPEVEVHLVGLRGGALYDTGEIDAGVELLELARAKAPDVWGDGTLSPGELR